MLRGQAANATRQLRSAFVVVSELRRVELPAGSTADIGFGCPPKTVVVRAVQLVRSPSAAQMETASSLPIQIAFELLGAGLAGLVAAGAVQAAAELPEVVDVGGEEGPDTGREEQPDH
jgi:hypothetical protein